MAIDAQPDLQATIAWPTPSDATKVRSAVHSLGPCGLTESAGRRAVRLTDSARRWLKTEDDNYLFAVLHAHIRFFGELLDELRSAELSHDEILGIANQRWGLDWRSLDPIRRRTSWLRACGLAELRFDHKITLTQAGVDLLSAIELQDPVLLVRSAIDPGSDNRFDLPPPSAPVRRLIDGLDEKSLRGRKQVMGYVPTGQGRDILASLRSVASTVMANISRGDLQQFCATTFDIKAGSFDSFLSTLKGIGLLEQIGLDKYTLTEAGRSWVESGDDLDLFRIVHANVFFIGELLYACELADRAPDLSRLAASQYDMSRIDTAGIRTRLHLLRSIGLVDEVGYARFRPSSLGIAIRETLPVLPPNEASIESDRAAETGGDTNSPLDEIADELIGAAVISNDSSRLERAVAAALRVLGLRAIHHGQSGQTDIVAEIVEAPSSTTTVIIDAKSAADGTIREGRINFDTLREHKLKHNATLAAVVGPEFDGDRLLERARTHEVALITASELAQVVRRQAEAPLSPAQIKNLFISGAKSAVDNSWQAAQTEMRLVTSVLGVLFRELLNADRVFDGALTPENVYLIVRSDVESPPTLKEITEVLNLLAHPLIRGVASKGGRFYSIEPPDTTAKRIRSLASTVQRVQSLLE
jgi:hypothetical protein